MKRMTLFLAGVLALGAIPAAAATLGQGQVRTVTGKISALDPRFHAVVVDVPAAKGKLVVGVTLENGAKILERGRSVGMDRLSPGERVKMTYARKGDELVGTRIAVEGSKDREGSK